MPEQNRELQGVASFGGVAAEDEPVLTYFLRTNAVARIESGSCFLVLGRKGTGKTALVRYFCESSRTPLQCRSVLLGGRPCQVRAQLQNQYPSSMDTAVASWRHVLATEFSSMILECLPADRSKDTCALRTFLESNYGGTRPSAELILSRPTRLSLSSLALEPSVLGITLGKVEVSSSASGDTARRWSLDAISQALLELVGRIAARNALPGLLLHIDELDRIFGEVSDKQRDTLVGLILAAREVSHRFRGMNVNVGAVVYLREDVWRGLHFSDKNKIDQSLAINLTWNEEQLQDLMELRLSTKLPRRRSLRDVFQQKVLRDAWKFIIDRTLLRPRDVIQFFNCILNQVKVSGAKRSRFTFSDVLAAEEQYSSYLRREFDDEIAAHWPNWDAALQTISAVGTQWFSRDDFATTYARRERAGDMPVDTILQMLYEFSLIGYRMRGAGGGTLVSFAYRRPDVRWDSAAEVFCVHPGLRATARLAESKASEWIGFDW